MADTDKRPALDVVREALDALQHPHEEYCVGDLRCRCGATGRHQLANTALAALPRLVEEARDEAGPRLTADMLVEACAAAGNCDEGKARARLAMARPFSMTADASRFDAVAAVLDPTGSLRAELARGGNVIT